jgi:aspartate aminotransferase-like enzyme
MPKTKKYKLFVPGPVNTAEGMKDIFYFRDSSFTNLVLENEKILLKILGCKNGRVIPYTFSGTGAMDAVVCNFIDRNDKILVVNGGTFGKRWLEICNFYKRKVEDYFVKFGENIDIKDFEKKVEEIKPDVILIQHHETSSGQLYNVKAIGKIARERGALFAVDIMCSFLADPYNMDDCCADISLISTQKGLQLDAGLSLVVLNSKAIKRSKKIEKNNYYNNLDFYLDPHNLGRGHAPFTPVVGIICQLNKKLRKINIKKEIELVKKKALFFRKEIVNLPLKIIAQNPSNFLTGLLITDKKYKTSHLDAYLKKSGIFTCPTNNVEKYLPGFADYYFRVAHTGCDKKEHKELIKKLKIFFKKYEK